MGALQRKAEDKVALFSEWGPTLLAWNQEEAATLGKPPSSAFHASLLVRLPSPTLRLPQCFPRIVPAEKCQQLVTRNELTVAYGCDVYALSPGLRAFLNPSEPC